MKTTENKTLENYDLAKHFIQDVPSTFIYSEDFNVISTIAEEITTLSRAENNPTGLYTTEGENFTTGFKIDSLKVLDKSIYVLNIPVGTGLLSHRSVNLSETQLLARMIKKNDFLESFLIGHANVSKYVIVNMELINFTEVEDEEEIMGLFYRPTRIMKMTNGYPLISEGEQNGYMLFAKKHSYNEVVEDYLNGDHNETVLGLLDI